MCIGDRNGLRLGRAHKAQTVAEPYAIPIVKTQIEEMKSSIGNKIRKLINVLHVKMFQSHYITVPSDVPLLQTRQSSQMLNKYSVNGYYSGAHFFVYILIYRVTF